MKCKIKNKKGGKIIRNGEEKSVGECGGKRKKRVRYKGWKSFKTTKMRQKRENKFEKSNTEMGKNR